MDAFWVASSSGYFLIIHGQVQSYVEGTFQIPHDTYLATDVASLFGGGFTWLPTIHGWAVELTRLAARYGVSERAILQDLLDKGHVRQRR